MSKKLQNNSKNNSKNNSHKNSQKKYVFDRILFTNKILFSPSILNLRFETARLFSSQGHFPDLSLVRQMLARKLQVQKKCHTYMFIKSYTLIRYLKIYLMNSCVDTSLTSVEELELAELIQLAYLYEHLWHPICLSFGYWEAVSIVSDALTPSNGG